MNEQPLRTTAVKRFLTANTHADLAALYNFDMEVQVLVGQHGGERKDSEYKGRRWSAWTDGVSTWKSFRVPYNAATEPEYTDVPMTFDLSKYAEGIGMTGWDWENRVSKWVAFDFDAIAGHSEKHSAKLSNEELDRVRSEASKLDWVTVRKSTSGKGLHLYVFLPDIKTINHTEHAALARSILGMMSATTGFGFNSKVDNCGGNMWVWHTKMQGTDGLTLLKSGGVLHDVPANWRDHIKVTSGKRKRTIPAFMQQTDENDTSFEQMTGQRVKVPLDNEHRRVIEYLREEFPNSWWFDQDHHMLVTHTYCLKKAHDDLQLKGVFETLATGKEADADHNCWAVPLRNGAWAVRRYTRGVKERETWDQDGQGFTRCFLNKEPDLSIACRACEGVEHPKGGFVFQNAEMAIKASLMLGVSVEIPNWALSRRAKLIQNKDGRLLVEIESDPTYDAQNGGLHGWLLEKKTWKRMYQANLDNQETEIETQRCDDLVRHIVDESGTDAGWVLKTDNEWHTEPVDNIKAALGSLGYQPKDVRMIVGSSVFQCWKMVNKPFQPEYPGDREWNRNAAQLAYTPNPNPDSQLLYPNWQKILDHCGEGLNEAIQKNSWAKNNGIKTGSDYLKLWVASVFQRPLEPLPYLFFYGPQGSGKSSFHEALQLLLKRGKGYTRADNALTNNNGFNGELEGAIICVIEETNMKRDKKAYDRIKDMVTSRELSIHIKGLTPFLSPNSTHWIQCANEITACPIFPGDTRITMIYVDLFPDTTVMMSKRQLFPLLEKEAPDFLAEIMNMEIPESNDRLMLPVIETDEKREAIEANQTILDEFVKEHCYHVTGEMILISDFYGKFMEYCPPDERSQWSKTRIGRDLCAPGSPYVKGRSPKNAQFHYGNIAWKPYDPERDGPVKPKLSLVDGMLR